MPSETGNRPSAIDAASGGELAGRKRIAIVRLSAIGDVINTLPALTAVRRARPDARIVWVVEAASVALLRGHPLLDDVIAVDRKGWERSLRKLRDVTATAGEIGGVLRTLREAEFDAAIDFQGNLRSGVVTFLTGAALRVGLARKDGKELNHVFTNRHVAMPARPLHRVERGLLLLEGLGVDTGGAEPVVPAADAERACIDEFLATSGLAAGGFAIVHAGTSEFGRYKQWPAERWAEVASRIRIELRLRVVLTRGPGDAEAAGAGAIASAATGAPVVAPLLSLLELGELCRRCRLFLSTDTGPMHLASAVGAPVVALFGPKDARLYGPYFGRSAVVEKPLDCRPCRKRSCDDPRCMLAITPEDVMAAARRLMRRG